MHTHADIFKITYAAILISLSMIVGVSDVHIALSNIVSYAVRIHILDNRHV